MSFTPRTPPTLSRDLKIARFDVDQDGEQVVDITHRVHVWTDDQLEAIARREFDPHVTVTRHGYDDAGDPANVTILADVDELKQLSEIFAKAAEYLADLRASGAKFFGEDA